MSVIEKSRPCGRVYKYRVTLRFKCYLTNYVIACSPEQASRATFERFWLDRMAAGVLH
jgi:hypothetical protein